MDGGCAPGEPAGAGGGGALAGRRGGRGGVGRGGMSGARAHVAASSRVLQLPVVGTARDGGDALGAGGGQSAGSGSGSQRRGLRMPGNPPAEWDSGTLGSARSSVAVPLRASPEPEVSLGISRARSLAARALRSRVSCPWGLRATDWGQFLPGAVPRKGWGISGTRERTARSPPLLVPAKRRLLAGVAPRERSVPLCLPGVFRPGWVSAGPQAPAPPALMALVETRRSSLPGSVGSLAPQVPPVLVPLPQPPDAGAPPVRSSAVSRAPPAPRAPAPAPQRQRLVPRLGRAGR